MASWFRSERGGKAIVAVAAPVTTRDGTLGAVVLQQGTDAILSLTNEGLARLINLTLIATILVAAALLGYATWLSRRIRRLSVAAEAALETESLQAALPSALARDEIGDLSRSFSNVLKQLGEYNAYLRSLASKLSHELRTPLAIVERILRPIVSVLVWIADLQMPGKGVEGSPTVTEDELREIFSEHGEVTDTDVDVFDREQVFIERVLEPTMRRFPELGIVFEHITTADAVEFVLDAEPRIGVFVCRCGINIAGVVDVPAVAEYAANLPFVEFATDNLYSCSQDPQEAISKIIKEKKLNRVVVAACTPKTHEPLFQETIRDAGLNPYLMQMTSIREHVSWVTSKREMATVKAIALISGAVERVSRIAMARHRVDAGQLPRAAVGAYLHPVQHHIDGGIHVFSFFPAVDVQAVPADIDFGDVSKFLNSQDDIGLSRIVKKSVESIQFVAYICFQMFRGIKIFEGNGCLHILCSP